MRIGYFQFKPLFGKVSRNLLKVTNALRDAKADLIVLPELPFTGYYFRDRGEVMSLAEDTGDSPIVAALTALCRERRFHIVTGFTEKRGDRCWNSALLIGRDGLIATYRKLHLFDEEKRWFDPGDIPLKTVNVDGARIGMLVCFDWVFPETWRVLALQGAEIVCHPSNLVLRYCQDAMRTRCIENGIFAVTANRYGADTRPHGEVRFTGKSQITAPMGKVLHSGPAQKEELFVVDVDPKDARGKKLTTNNDLMADRRPEFYAELARR
jgi:predicted amidohydrolase